MKKTAIKVENLSKVYRLGEIGTGTISRDMERWFKTKVLKQEDPFLKIGEANDRSNKGNSDIVYSLRDINFEINQGDAVGIIGRNGAGKSTLLKILSRVTTPTTGKINIKGRVASLLEVGTGFHPELTGRENIYLNGAILGMRKREIDRKLDEIIEFSGVERFIDTPVKRYSSGMFVRLAFAVSAFLESEILIVDEVLAVGDLEFQNKCLGKMGEISSNEGRTILFVSHNIESIRRLCDKGILINQGEIKQFGKIEDIISTYKNDLPMLISEDLKNGFIRPFSNQYSRNVEIKNVQLFQQKQVFNTYSPINFSIELTSKIIFKNGRFAVSIHNSLDECIGVYFGENAISMSKNVDASFIITLKDHFLAKGIYYLNIGVGFGNELTTIDDYDFVKNVLCIKIDKLNLEADYFQWGNNWGSINYPKENLIVREL
jgi:lipopolysaccharide transport system ATP-binding protein